jgi:hypothetical protein
MIRNRDLGSVLLNWVDDATPAAEAHALQVLARESVIYSNDIHSNEVSFDDYLNCSACDISEGGKSRSSTKSSKTTSALPRGEKCESPGRCCSAVRINTRPRPSRTSDVAKDGIYLATSAERGTSSSASLV